MSEKNVEVVVDTEQSDPREYQVFKTENWVAKLPKTQNESTFKKLQEMINNREPEVEWKNQLRKFIVSKLYYREAKQDFLPEEVFNPEEFVAIEQAWIDYNELSLKPEQKTVEESSQEDE